MMTERKVRRLSADRGWVVHSAHRGKHWRVLASYAGGRAMPFTLASSPSDWREELYRLPSARRPGACDFTGLTTPDPTPSSHERL